MSSSGSSELVDDSNPSVQYQSGWIWDQGVAEVDATRHGANTAGLRAWLSFTGTGVRVVGTLGASDTFGQPKTTYLIDGKVAGTYSAPLTPSGETQYNVTFFSARDLSPGDHIVLINNTDGTSPNTFWLDYFLVDAVSSSTEGAGSSSATVNPQPGVSSVSVQYVTSVSGTETIISTVSATVPVGGSPTSAANTNSDPSAGSSHASHSNAGVIAGATVAGVAVLAILALAFFCLRRRRRPDGTQAGTVAPFTFAQEPSVIAHQSSMQYFTNTGATLPGSAAVSHFGHRPSTAPPSEVAPESVVSQPESYTPSASSGAGLLAPLRRAASPTTSFTSAARRPAPTSEKSHRSRSDPDTPSLGFSPTPGTGPESEYSQSTPQTPASPAFSSASGSTPLMPPAALPPGAWHAPPDSHGRAHTLLRSLFSRGSRAVPSADTPTAPRDVDSGLRLYDDVVLPPPYTQE